VDTDPPPNCVSNDFIFQQAYLAENEEGDRLLDCTLGDSTIAYICLTFDKGNGSTRRGFYISATVNDGPNNLYEINHCFDSVFTGQALVTLCIPMEIITFTCGSELYINNAYFAWGAANEASNICIQTSGCATPKCDFIAGDTIIITPLVSNFDYITACTGSDSTETLSFENLTTGGVTPLSYFWDFGDAPGDTSNLENPTFAYPDTGTYNVTLITTDDTGWKDTIVKSVYIDLVAGAFVEAGFLGAGHCSNGAISLDDLNPSIGGAVTTGTWSSSGNGMFDSNGNFGGFTPATSYTLGTSDIDTGFVKIYLTSDDPEGSCPAVMDSVQIYINDMRCSTFPYAGG
jgi:PKD repeat protein